MLGRAAGCVAAATATYALGVSGFLLPPGANSFDESLLNINAEDANSQAVRIPCAACAFSTKQGHVEGVGSEDDIYRIEGGANELLLDFTTSEDGRHLELNGKEIYPPVAWQRVDELVVYQVPAGSEDAGVPLKVTSHGLMMDRNTDAEGAEASLITVHFAVLGVENQLMQLQTVKVDLLKTGEELILVKADVEKDDKTLSHPPHRGPPGFRPHFGGPPFHGPPPGMTMEKECGMLPAPVCRFKHMLEFKIGRLRHKKPCPGRPGPPGRLSSHVRPPLSHLPAYGEHHRPHHGRPHNMRPWHHRPHGYHHHHHDHHWAGAFVQGFIAVLIPVAAGISVGLTVSLIGLLFGRLITMIWMKLARRGSESSDCAAASVEEGKGLMLVGEDEDEQLPAYEDAPAYEESDGKVSY